MKKAKKFLWAALFVLSVFFVTNVQVAKAEDPYVDETKLSSTDLSRVTSEEYTLEVGKEYEIISDKYSSNSGIRDHYVSFIAPELEDDEEFYLIFHYESCFALVDIFDSKMNQIASDLGDSGGAAYDYNQTVDLRNDLSAELVAGERYYIKMETLAINVNSDVAQMKLIQFIDYPEHTLTCNQDYIQKMLYIREEYVFVAPVTASYTVNVDFFLMCKPKMLRYDIKDWEYNSVKCTDCFMNEGYISAYAIEHTYHLKAGETYYLILGNIDKTYAGAGICTQDVKIRISTDAQLPDESENLQFTDVNAGDWFAEDVKKIAKMGLMTGTNETTFAPNTNMSRAMMVTTLYRLAGKPEVTNYIATKIFPDVEAGSWYEDSVNWAYNTGITTGYTDVNGNATYFGTEDYVTREQLAVFLYRFAEKEGYPVNVSVNISNYVGYSDISDYALEAMKWAVGAGLISGVEYTENGVTTYALEPKESATRAQLATILVRFCEYYKIA